MSNGIVKLRRYALFMGLNNYPQPGDKDLKGFFSSQEEAESAAIALMSKPNFYNEYDWHRVVDLSVWAESQEDIDDE